MVKVLYGEKGTGKTKILIETANRLASQDLGDVVFIDDSNQLMYDLKREVRFVNINDFPIKTDTALSGFICGAISQNFDIKAICIDGLAYILKQGVESLDGVLSSFKHISESLNIDFYISINGKKESMPEFIKEYLV